MNALNITATALNDYELFYKSHIQKLITEKSELFVEHSLSYNMDFKNFFTNIDNLAPFRFEGCDIY